MVNGFWAFLVKSYDKIHLWFLRWASFTRVSKFCMEVATTLFFQTQGVHLTFPVTFSLCHGLGAYRESIRRCVKKIEGNCQWRFHLVMPKNLVLHKNRNRQSKLSIMGVIFSWVPRRFSILLPSYWAKRQVFSWVWCKQEYCPHKTNYWVTLQMQAIFQHTGQKSIGSHIRFERPNT